MATWVPPELMDELVEEILLRIPPDDPARLVRASIACKRWCRLVCDPGFRRRFRERYPTPPLLGVIRNCIVRDLGVFARFVPTTSFFRPHRADRHGWRAIDCFHGHVLLSSEPKSWRSRSTFAVWDPITDAQRELPALPQSPHLYSTNAAVLCADRGGCNLLDRNSRPYLVVFVGVYDAGTFACIYSSEADAWGEPTSAQYLGFQYFSKDLRGAHAGNAVYFVMFGETRRILEYDLVTGEMTLIDPPPTENRQIVLTILESGGLGCVTVKSSALYLWSREVGPDRDMRWAQSKLIDYKIPVDRTMRTFDVFGFADGGGVIYVGTESGVFMTDLKSGRFMEVGGVSDVETMVPIMSFYLPALRVGL